MKKILSVLFSAAILFCSVFGGYTQAYANTKKTAPEISLYQSVNMSVSSGEKKYMVKFVPQSTGYYEFVCSNIPYNTLVIGTISDYSDEVLMQNAADAASSDFITAAELTAGERYYFEIETDGTPYYTSVTVRYHNHRFSMVQNIPAVYDSNDIALCDDGGSYVFCEYCTGYYTNALYYYPVSMSLSKTNYTYNGKAKTPSVTVYDRLGNAIPSSEYTVKYKNNTKPGYATAAVTMNGINYKGSFTGTMLIKPKKMAVSSIKAGKSKSLTVKWSKDKTVSGYQIRYSTSKKFYKSKTKTIKISKKNNSKTITKLKANKKYYVQLRSYKTSGGKNIYGEWSKVKTIKTAK